MKSFFQKAFCVSLDRKPESWRRFRDNLPSDWPFCEVERFPAVDGLYSQPADWWSVGNAAWGCYQSHLQIIEYCLHENIDSCLILEDDAICCEQFSQRAAQFLKSLPSDWEMIYLGGQHLVTKEYPPVRVNAHVLIPFDVNRTHAYAIKGRSALLRLHRHLKDHESWQTGHHIDHHLGQLISRRELPVYCPCRWLIGQNEGTSTISGAHFPRRFFEFDESIHELSSDFVAVMSVNEGAGMQVASELQVQGLFSGKRLDDSSDRYTCPDELLELGDKYLPFPLTSMNGWEGTLRCDLFRWLRYFTFVAAREGTFAMAYSPQFCQWAPILESILQDRLRIVVVESSVEQSVCRKLAQSPFRNDDQMQQYVNVVKARQRHLQRFLAKTHKTVLHIGCDQLSSSTLPNIEAILGDATIDRDGNRTFGSNSITRQIFVTRNNTHGN